MRRDPRALLWDAREAALAIADFIEGRSMEDYLADRMLRSAVERQCEIIGEALSQLRALAPDIAASIPDLRRAVAFRNLLIHGYAAVDDRVVWRTITEDLPRLAAAVATRLSEGDRRG
jgi:uncharacterized protein with HEPN domain